MQVKEKTLLCRRGRASEWGGKNAVHGDMEGVLVLVVVRSKWSWEWRADKLKREGMFILAVALNVEKDGKNKF